MKEHVKILAMFSAFPELKKGQKWLWDKGSKILTISQLENIVLIPGPNKWEIIRER